MSLRSPSSLKSMARNRYPEAEQLKQIKGVGTLIALTYMLTLEDPHRFRKSRDAACYVEGDPYGWLGTSVANYPLHRRREDPDYATQSHTNQMNALVKATRDALAQTNVRGEDAVGQVKLTSSCQRTIFFTQAFSSELLGMQKETLM